MIHPNTPIQYLDIKDGEPRYKTIDELYQEYCHKAFPGSNYSNEIMTIDFTNSNVKITDLFGWTDLRFVLRMEIDPERTLWLNLKGANKSILVDSMTNVPLYIPSDTTRGFHGEVKHKYDLLEDLNPNHHVRIRNGEDENGESVEFAKPEIYATTDDVKHAYIIITKSSFYNANGINLFGGFMSEKIKLNKKYR